MKKILAISLLVMWFYAASAQKIPLTDGWKFKAGDSLQWAKPDFNDKGWQSISVFYDWELQGHLNYDGFGWYRVHVFIPASLKENAYLKDSVRFEMGMGDDGDEVYLNGKLIGKNKGQDVDITKGLFGICRYVIPANNPAILWGKDNVIAIRIYDSGGAGGVYGEPDMFKISMVDLMDYTDINTTADFAFGEKSSLSKSIKMETRSHYVYSGKLTFTATDPQTGGVLYQKTNDANFAKGSPFTYKFSIADLQKKSYLLTYDFLDEKSGKHLIKTEYTPYILTPYVRARPQINGANVYGAHPNNPFLYRIPATGQKPLDYKAGDLPEGLTLDPATGIITGTVTKAGYYPVVFTVHNNVGTATKKFMIKIGDVIGLTPTLGWNSWNAFGLSVNDARVRTAAKTIADKLGAHGWSYVNIDDGWEAVQRAADGSIVANEKFPDMKGLSGYVHSLGLKFGIYSSPGPRTCGNYLGSYQHEEQDAKTYADWGIDYLKYDWCSYLEIVGMNPPLEIYKKPYILMRSALDKVNRDILFSFCQYGMGDSWNWAGEIGGNSWRTTSDIQDTWRSMTDIGFTRQAEAPHARPGHFNDPDMLVVGKVGWGDNQHNTHLTPDEQYTHISLWSLLSSPLLIGCDLGRLDGFTLNLLTNDEVLAISQDELGKEATQIVKKDDYLIYVKELKDGGKAVGIFNTGDKYKTINISWSDLGISGYTKVRDVWRQKYLITNNKELSGTIPSHGVLFVRLEK